MQVKPDGVVPRFHPPDINIIRNISDVQFL